jgi:hypothetical protein
MVTDIELFESPDLIALDFCLWGWMKSEVYQRRVDIRGELRASIVDADARIKKREGPFTRTIGELRTRVSMFIELDCAIFEHLL